MAHCLPLHRYTHTCRLCLTLEHVGGISGSFQWLTKCILVGAEVAAEPQPNGSKKEKEPEVKKPKKAKVVQSEISCTADAMPGLSAGWIVKLIEAKKAMHASDVLAKKAAEAHISTHASTGAHATPCCWASSTLVSC